jgi:hypothetical protein
MSGLVGENHSAKSGSAREKNQEGRTMSRMFCRRKRIVLGTITIAIAGALLLVAPLQAEVIRHNASDNVFYNGYVAPAGPGTVGAQLYPCPRPAPARVGYTYITYPPLMPQEFLYRHARTYRTPHEDAPPTRTTVRWGHCWW